MTKTVDQKVYDLEKRIAALEIMLRVVGASSSVNAEIIADMLITMSGNDKKQKNVGEFSRLIGCLQEQHDRMRYYLPAEVANGHVETAIHHREPVGVP